MSPSLCTVDGDLGVIWKRVFSEGVFSLLFSFFFFSFSFHSRLDVAMYFERQYYGLFASNIVGLLMLNAGLPKPLYSMDYRSHPYLFSSAHTLSPNGL
jgi:hypothetical protein